MRILAIALSLFVLSDCKHRDQTAGVKASGSGCELFCEDTGYKSCVNGVATSECNAGTIADKFRLPSGQNSSNCNAYPVSMPCQDGSQHGNDGSIRPSSGSYSNDSYSSSDSANLTAEDRAIIARYVKNFGPLNLPLWRGERPSSAILRDIGVLTDALRKLPSFRGIVYRGIQLKHKELESYRTDMNNSRPHLEKGFLSTSKELKIAQIYKTMPPATGDQAHDYDTEAKEMVLLTITSRSGRDISQYSPVGEQEVLFAPQTSFDIISIQQANGYTQITMREH